MKYAYSNIQIFTLNSNSEWLYVLKWQTGIKSPETDSIQLLLSTHNPGHIDYPCTLLLLSNQLSWIFNKQPNILGWSKWEMPLSACTFQTKSQNRKVPVAPGYPGSQVKQAKSTNFPNACSFWTLWIPQVSIKSHKQTCPLPQWQGWLALLPIRLVFRVFSYLALSDVQAFGLDLI